MPIENVSDTARWVAAYRAMETRRPDAIFSDPFAERLAGARGARMAAEMPRTRDAAWSMAIRTAVFDALVRELASGVDLVVNLAAGLDARPWRLDLPRTLRWVDVDLPEILQYKTDLLKDQRPKVAYDAIAADLRDGSIRQSLFAQLSESSNRALVLSEGLLVYLKPADVAALAADLHVQPHFHWWVFDLLSAQVARVVAKSWSQTLDAANASFRFAPEEGTAFFTPFGWREAQYRSMMVEGQRLGRDMAKGWLWRLVARLSPPAAREKMRRATGIVVLERE